jgi:HEAT repeat protein
MVDAPSASWNSTLIGMLGQPIKHPTTGKTKEQQRDLIDPYRDQLFWQVTAAQVLGETGGSEAVEPLLKVLLDPGKGDIATTALLALVKIGKPAVARSIKLLDESDPLVKFYKENIKKATDAKELPKGNPALPIAAAVIGMAGRSEGIDPLIAAMNKSGVEDSDKAVLAQELTKIPATAKSKKAFMEAFESIPASAEMGNGSPALVVLAEAAGDFYDPSMVDWLLAQARSAKGSGDERKAVQQTLATTALKIAKSGQLDAVKAAAKAYSVDDLLKYGAPVLEKCGDKVDCYLTEVEKTENQSKEKQVAGIKAAYMIGILGNDKARDELIDRLPSLENAAVHFVATKSVDKLTPKGSPEVVEKLEELIEKNEKSADQDKLAANQPLKQVAYRISARAN